MSDEGRELISRPPRIQPPDLKGSITIPDPPDPRFKGGILGWTLIILPLIIIIGSVAASVAVALLGSGNALFLLALMVGMIGAFVTGIFTTVEKINSDKQASREYLELLNRREATLQKHTRLHRESQEYLYPSLEEALHWVKGRDPRLWERRPGDPDFLTLRLGLGSISNSMQISTPNSDHKVPNLDKALGLVETYREIKNVPNFTELEKIAFLGICGPTPQAVGVTRALLSHLVVHHSPTEVQIMLVYPPAREAEWEWLGWLPHCRVETKSGRDFVLLASQADRCEQLMEYLMEQIRERTRLRDQEGFRPSGQEKKGYMFPNLVLVVDDFELVQDQAAIKRLFEQAGSLGIYLISVSQTLTQIPGQCRARAEIMTRPGGFLLRYSIAGQKTAPVKVEPDLPRRDFCLQLALEMSPFKLKVPLTKGEFAASVRLLDMVGADTASSHLFDPLVWWQRSSMAQLSVPVGRLFGGQELKLDFSDKAHGPHGLIAGTTGSGKSELLLTMVASLALNNSPDQVKFVLGDFKGGTSFISFEKLPHVVGMISNENFALVERAIKSLVAEKSRRERLLNAEGVKHIREYQKKKPTPKEPLPYLFVIIDEFAEMREAVPDLIDNLETIARTGRTLGIHLVLAAQRPAGVVTPQLNSNTKFRICLRVETGEDSSELLGRKDAANIPSSAPGRAYFRVGSDVYEQFQVARVAEDFLVPGENSEQSSEQPAEQPAEILVIENSWGGYPLVPRFLKKKSSEDEDNQVPKDYDIITQQCIQAARRTVLRDTHRPWLDTLKPFYHVPELLARLETFNPITRRWPETPPLGQGVAPAGIMDNVLEQKQPVWCVDLARHGNYCVSGRTGSGRTTFLRSMLTGLSLTHRPDLLRYYIIDLSNNLGSFAGLPHTQAYLSMSQSGEIKNMLTALVNEFRNRQDLFNQNSAPDITAYRRKQGQLIPDIVVVVNNFSSIRNNPPFDTELLKTLVRDGKARGIHVVITLDRSDEYEFGRLREQFFHIVLQQAREFVPFNVPVAMLGAWANTPGRGFVRDEEPNRPPLELQVAFPLPIAPAELVTGLDDLVNQMRQAARSAPNPQNQARPVAPVVHTLPVVATPKIAKIEEIKEAEPEIDWEAEAARIMQERLAALQAGQHLDEAISQILDVKEEDLKKTR